MSSANSSENVGVAFALVIAAGAATGFGAGVVYVPKLVSLASCRTLAMSLGFSAGVMVFVSFAEIFRKSTSSFEGAGWSNDAAFSLSMVCFFAGVIIMLILNLFVEHTMGGHSHSPGVNIDPAHALDTKTTGRPSKTGNESQGESSSGGGCTSKSCKADCKPYHKKSSSGSSATATDDTMDLESPSCIQACGVNGCGEDDGWGINICPGCSKDAAGQWDSYINMADKMIAFEKKKEEKQMVWDAGIPEATLEAAHPQFAVLTQEEKRKEENDKLIQMSYKTAFAIALHNFPEGLATFVAALSDPKVGAVLAVAIAIHNIPEGVCVALPLYYATANKTKAFWWGVLSGLSEPLAALLGWAILANSFSDALFGILFGIVSGMMVLISVRELLPTAHRYDPEDTVVTFAFTGGMAVMGLSLGVFLL